MARKSLHAKRCLQKTQGHLDCKEGDRGAARASEQLFKSSRSADQQASTAHEGSDSATCRSIRRAPCAADNERGAAEHDDREVAGQGEEDEDEEEEEGEEEDEDKDEDESEDKDDDEKEGASEHDEVKKVEREGNKEFPRGVEC